MKSAHLTLVSVAVTFLGAAVFYVLAYSWLTRKQTDKGPWEVTFTNNAGGVPQIVIAQPRLGISNVVVRLAGETLAPTNRAGRVAFTKPNLPLPFGAVMYDDLMFLPGDVTLDLFGHAVEMVPVTLGLNGRGIGWTNNSLHLLWPTNKAAEEIRARSKGGYDKKR